MSAWFTRNRGVEHGQAAMLAALIALTLGACSSPAEQTAGQPAGGGEPVRGNATQAPPSTNGGGGALTSQGESIKGAVSGLTGEITDLSVRVTDVATIVDLAADVLFEFDKFTLAPGADTTLDKLLTYVQAGATGKIVISGYTDAKGEDAYNLTLSQKRAQAVADWLKGKGVDAARLDVVGKGEADPVAPNAKSDGSDDPDGRAKNRRVSVAIPR